MDVPRLLVLNGSPGLGKSTLARRYAADHPLALVLDVDDVRAMLGRWEDDPTAAGLAARDLAAAMARTHLAAGHDVVVAQLVARSGFLEVLDEVAEGADATMTEVVLTAGRDEALERAARHPARVVDPAEAAALWDRLAEHVATRPHSVTLRVDGAVEDAYAGLVALVGPDRETRRSHQSPTNGSTSGT